MTGLVDDPLFYALLGQQAGNQASAAADKISMSDEYSLKMSEMRTEQTNMNIGIVQTIVSLRQQVDSLSEIEGEYILGLAGLRGVTREILSELRRADPNNPLLDKKSRDSVFVTSVDNQKKRQEGTSSARERFDSAPKYREGIYGTADSTKGGPEKSQITPNAAVRKAAGVPENHVPDRERFLALIGKLAAELKAHDPDAPILNDKEMVDVFETINLKFGN